MAYFVVVAAIVAIVVFFRFFWPKYVAGGVFKSSKRLDGKTVIITGGNTGIGKETAVDLARRGARVIIACRNALKGTVALKEIQEQSNSQQVFLEQLDLASFKSIRYFAERMVKNERSLHILINNAGVAYIYPFSKTEDGFETQFGVNHLGHFLLTNLLLDLLKRSAPSRVVNVSSVAHKLTKEFKFDDINNENNYNCYTAYFQSKLANIHFTRELAKRLEGTGVTTYAVHPGSVSTELARHVGSIAMFFVNVFKFLFLKTPQQGAQTTLYCAVSDELEGVTGRYYADCADSQPTEYAKDDQAAKKLWDLSSEFVGIK